MRKAQLFYIVFTLALKPLYAFGNPFGFLNNITSLGSNFSCKTGCRASEGMQDVQELMQTYQLNANAQKCLACPPESAANYFNGFEEAILNTGNPAFIFQILGQPQNYVYWNSKREQLRYTNELHNAHNSVSGKLKGTAKGGMATYGAMQMFSGGNEAEEDSPEEEESY